MIVFAFYVIGILVLTTVCAIVADVVGWFRPDWDPGEGWEDDAR